MENLINPPLLKNLLTLLNAKIQNELYFVYWPTFLCLISRAPKLKSIALFILSDDILLELLKNVFIERLNFF